MIIGNNRNRVIENIRAAVTRGDFNAKVEINDPVLSPKESKAVTDRYLAARKTAGFKLKSFFARKLTDIATRVINMETVIEGNEILSSFDGGAVITSNHFGPLENTVIRRLVKSMGKKRLNIVSQVTNFAMNGIIGFLMNYSDTVPLSDDFRYLNGDFMSVLSELMQNKEMVLIYPEQEMWFNYRKPRPLKRGAYFFAAKLNVPIISCFVEIKDTEEKDTEEFYKIKYVLHVLGILYPDPEKDVRTNSFELCKKDYAFKKAAYEKAYGKTLDYTFENCDIAGWTGN